MSVSREIQGVTSTIADAIRVVRRQYDRDCGSRQQAGLQAHDEGNGHPVPRSSVA